MAMRTVMPVEDFLRLPESVGDRDVRYELVGGELVKLAPEMLLHNRVRDSVLIALLQHVNRKNCGTAIGMQHFHLFGNTIRRPDVALVRAGRTIPPDTLPEGAPDLAVEVVPPTNTPREIHQRISDYFAAGSKRVWVFYPEEREIYVHGPGGVTRRRGDELLEEPELLPGFSVKVSSFFE
jgi:Uma2 family endonuclease